MHLFSTHTCYMPHLYFMTLIMSVRLKLLVAQLSPLASPTLALRPNILSAPCYSNLSPTAQTKSHTHINPPQNCSSVCSWITNWKDKILDRIVSVQSADISFMKLGADCRGDKKRQLVYLNSRPHVHFRIDANQADVDRTAG
jgi:hypothetical protein